MTRKYNLFYNYTAGEGQGLFYDLVEAALMNTRNIGIYGKQAKISILNNKSYRKAMNRKWSKQKPNPALKSKTGNK